MKKTVARLCLSLALMGASWGTLAGPAAAGGTLRLTHDLGMGGAETLDPYDPNRFWPTMNLVFDRLVAPSPKGEAVPELAISWSASPDVRTWTFKLRPGVTFQDGTPFTSEDVVYSIDRMTDPTFNSPVRSVLGIIRQAKAIDPLTVELDLSTGEADLPLLLADYRALMTKKGSAGSFKDHPVGTGPFKVESISVEGTTVLDAYPGYWRGKPHLDKVEVVAIADSAARIQALLGNQVDLLLTIDPKQAPLVDHNQAITTQHVATGDWNGLMMRVDEKPFDDPRVRKAMRIAVDRAALTTLVLGKDGGVPTCDDPVWQGDQYSWQGTCGRDVEGARKLLADAGYPDGIDVELMTSDVEENMVAIAEAYQAQAKDAGIRVKVTTTASDGYWDKVWMKMPFFVDSWGQRPATQVLNEGWRSGSPWNPTHQADPAFDKMLDEARGEPDFAKRRDRYLAVQEKLYEITGGLIPYHKVILRAMSSHVKGLDPVLVDCIRWDLVSMDE